MNSVGTSRRLSGTRTGKCFHTWSTAPIEINANARIVARHDIATSAPIDQSRSGAALRTVLRIACDLLRLVSAAARSHAQLAAENLSLRKQLALHVERQVKPRRAGDAIALALRETLADAWMLESDQ